MDLKDIKTLFNYLLFKEPMKATQVAVDIVSDILKISTGMFAVKFSVKLSPASAGFVNYSGLKFAPDFQNTEAAF